MTSWAYVNAQSWLSSDEHLVHSHPPSRVFCSRSRRVDMTGTTTSTTGSTPRSRVRSLRALYYTLLTLWLESLIPHPSLTYHTSPWKVTQKELLAKQVKLIVLRHLWVPCSLSSSSQPVSSYQNVLTKASNQPHLLATTYRPFHHQQPRIKTTTMSDNSSIRKDNHRSASSAGESSTMNTSMSTLLSDPAHELFHHSITDLDSFSTSLDFDRHLPSVEAREDFLSNLMDEEEINPINEDSFQSSFAYDMFESSIPARLGTILDQAFEDDEEEEGESSSSPPCCCKTAAGTSNHPTSAGVSPATAKA